MTNDDPDNIVVFEKNKLKKENSYLAFSYKYSYIVTSMVASV